MSSVTDPGLGRSIRRGLSRLRSSLWVELPALRAHHMPHQGRRSGPEPWLSDLIVGGIAAAALFAGLVEVEAFEWFYEFSRSHEDWDLDELVLTVPVLGFISAWFAWRRWREVRQHLRTRAEMQRELYSTAEDRDFLISAAGGAFYSFDAGNDFTVLHVDPNIEAQTGYTPEAFTEDPGFWRSMVHPADRDRVFTELPKLFEVDYQVHEYRFRHADGSYRWLRDQLKLKRRADGTPDRVVGLWTDITSQKTAKQVLETAVAVATTEVREREAHLRLITDHLPVLVVYIDTDLRYSFVNRTAAAWYAHAPEELVGKSASDVLGPESFAAVQPYLEGASKGCQSAFEANLAYPDGRTRVIHGLYVPDRDEAGRVKGFIAMALDITDRKRAENELRAKKRQLELILNNVPTRIFYKDDKNRILRLNEPAARSIGLTVEQAEGTDCCGHFPGLAKKYHADDLEVIRTGKPKLGLVEEQATKEGERSWVRTDRVPYVDPETGERFVFVAVSDITAEKLAEERVKASEERYRSLYTKTPVMLHSVDGEGRIISVSDFWLDKLGYSSEEVKGRKITDFMTPESAQKALTTEVPRFLKDGTCKGLEYQIVTKSGDVLDIALSSVAEYDEAGTFKRSMAVLTDVTERKIVERQLIQAQKMESVGQLTGGLAHDFNNLLGVVMGNLELLEDTLGENEEAALFIKPALEAIERGAELNRRLLAFARRQRLETRSVEPNPLIESLGGLLKRTLGEAIALECRLGQQIPPVRTDPSQLESAILNLAVNARDAMPDGGRLTIETAQAHLDEDYATRESEVLPGDYVVLSVTDSGQGIPAEQIDKVFEPFFTTKEVGRGSGLGLSMVYGFIKQSGGHVRVYSEAGFGTTVRLYLPVQDEGTDLSRPLADPRPEIRGGNETVLLVEDQTEVRTLAVSLLQSLGYSVLEATNGPHALILLEEHDEIDLLFTDIVMPGGMDGTQVAKAARKLRPGLPVLYATGYAEAAVLRQGDVKETENLVTKPYRRKELAHKLRQAFEQKADEQSAAETTVLQPHRDPAEGEQT